MAPTSPASPPPHVHPLVGDDPAEIGGHRLIGRLGGSGMGVVYAAVSPDGKAVALKAAHAEWAPGPVPAPAPDRGPSTEPDSAPEVSPEAAPAEGLTLNRRTWGVCGVGATDSGSFGGRPWSVVAYVPGHDLARHVRVTGPLSETALLVLAAGTAEALASIHAAGVPHGDVKPGNVIVAPDGPRLIDHGIARQIDDGDSRTTAGSSGWLAPERYVGTQPDTGSDMFSWACLVVFAATGRAPFDQGGSLPEMARRAREDTVDLSAADLPGVPDELRLLLARALSVDPAERPPAEEAYLECLLLAGVEDDATRETWAERLSGIARVHWPRVDVGWHEPAAWTGMALALTEAATAGTAGAAAGTGRVRRRGSGRFLALAVAGSVLVAAGTSGYLLMDSTAEEPDATAASSEEEPVESVEVGGNGDGEPGGPLSGIGLVSASLDSFLAAGSFELTMLTHAGNGEGYRQPLPIDTSAVPTLFDRVLHRSGPSEVLRWTSTVSGARTTDLMMAEGNLLRGEDTAWNGPATWYEAEPRLLAAEGAFVPEQIVEPMVRAVENGTVTAESETVFTPPPPVEDAYGHLAGEVSGGVPAIRVEGEFRASDAPGQEASTFILVATEDGIPLSFAVEGMVESVGSGLEGGSESGPGGGHVLNGRPVPHEAPAAFLAPAPQVERWYTEYTFVSLGVHPDIQIPDAADVLPATSTPAPHP